MRPQHRQIGVGQQRQRHVTIPAAPFPHLVVVQTDLVRARLETLLHGPARARHPDLLRQRRRCWGEDPIVRQLRPLPQTAAHQQPQRPAGRRGLRQRHLRPVVPARPFAARLYAQPLPGVCWQASRERLDALAPHPGGMRHRQVGVLADRQHVGLRSPFQPAPQCGVRPVDAIRRDPGARHLAVQCPLELLLRQRRLGLEADLVRNAGRTAALPVVGPVPGQIQVAVEVGGGPGGGVDEEDAELTVLGAPGGAAVLPLHPRRVDALLEEGSLINHEHVGGIAQLLHDVGPQIVAHRVHVPVGHSQQPLHAIGSGLAGLLGQLPAVLAFNRAQETTQVGESAAPRFRPPKARRVAPQAGPLTRRPVARPLVPTWPHSAGGVTWPSL
jgi:hypothetical protein